MESGKSRLSEQIVTARKWREKNQSSLSRGQFGF